MPTYVYRCKQCQRDIEALQRFSDAPLTTCEYCGGELQRLLFPPAIIFKGSGWYCKDHPKSSSGGNGGSHLEKGHDSTATKPSDGQSTAGADSATTSTAVETKSETKES